MSKSKYFIYFSDLSINSTLSLYGFEWSGKSSFGNLRQLNYGLVTLSKIFDVIIG